MYISVVIPTYNPNIQRLAATLEGLKCQTLPLNKWELIVIDNNSGTSFADKINISWHPEAKIVSEKSPGLTYARLKGFSEAKGEIVVLVDDDNVLNENYLQETSNIFTASKTLGAIGGKSLPIFEKDEPKWLGDFHFCLALRNLGDAVVIEKWQNKYPVYAPIGAGIAIRKKALKSYTDKVSSGRSTITDRKGTSLSSGGDNDMVLEIIKSGWETGYFPNLILHHIIPNERLEIDYLGRLARELSKSWIQILELHQISPWTKIPAWSVPLRKMKAWIVYGAWKNNQNYIKWKGACGTFEGLAD